MGSTSNEAINMSGYPSLSLGATGNTTSGGILTPSATTYNLGGGGGILTVSSTSLTGQDFSYGDFISGPGNVIFAASNTFTYRGPTSIGSAGTLDHRHRQREQRPGAPGQPERLSMPARWPSNHGDSATSAAQ